MAHVNALAWPKVVGCLPACGVSRPGPAIPQGRWFLTKWHRSNLMHILRCCDVRLRGRQAKHLRKDTPYRGNGDIALQASKASLTDSTVQTFHMNRNSCPPGVSVQGG